MTATHLSASGMRRLELKDPGMDGIAVFRDLESKYESRITCPNSSEYVRPAAGDGFRIKRIS